MSNQQASIRFNEARAHYVARRFHEARTAMRRYKKIVDYEKFNHVDNRPTNAPEISVIIVSYGTERGLIECLETVLQQQGPVFEIIVVDNGRNEAVHDELRRLPLLWLSPPLNLLPSEGRNVGAHHARSNLLVFLDDDGLMLPGYLAAATSAVAAPNSLGLRGRIIPKTPKTQTPPHYDLGEVPLPSEFNLEGNMVIRKGVFDTIGGFDPLMFGHEGKALTHYARLSFRNGEIQYRNDLVIKHDWAEKELLDEKLERQKLGKEYLEYLESTSINAGSSILIDWDGMGKNIEEFLTGFLKGNTYRPVEVLIRTGDSKKALEVTRPFVQVVTLRVLPAFLSDENEIVSLAKFENLIKIKLPYDFKDDIIENWIRRNNSGIPAISLIKKTKNDNQKNLTKKVSEKQIDLVVVELNEESQETNNETKQKDELKSNSNKKLLDTIEESKELKSIDLKIQEKIKYITELSAKKSKKENEIADLDEEFMSISENDLRRLELSKKLESMVVESAQLTLHILDANCDLQDLRILKIKNNKSLN